MPCRAGLASSYFRCLLTVQAHSVATAVPNKTLPDRDASSQDVEFAVAGDEVQVRSSSRLGYLDFGVNAKRLNWIAGDLRKKGWRAEQITKATHPDYFAENTR